VRNHEKSRLQGFSLRLMATDCILYYSQRSWFWKCRVTSCLVNYMFSDFYIKYDWSWFIVAGTPYHSLTNGHLGGRYMLAIKCAWGDGIMLFSTMAVASILANAVMYWGDVLQATSSCFHSDILHPQREVNNKRLWSGSHRPVLHWLPCSKSTEAPDMQYYPIFPSYPASTHIFSNSTLLVPTQWSVILVLFSGTSGYWWRTLHPCNTRMMHEATV